MFVTITKPKDLDLTHIISCVFFLVLTFQVTIWLIVSIFIMNTEPCSFLSLSVHPELSVLSQRTLSLESWSNPFGNSLLSLCS